MVFQQNLKRNEERYASTRNQSRSLLIPVSVLKPLHASWVTNLYDKMENEIDTVLNLYFAMS